MHFTINNLNWRIEETTQEEIKKHLNKICANEEENTKSKEHRYFGITFHDEQAIYLDEDLPEDRKIRTLLHELTHCYINVYITHIDKTYTEEEVADIVSNSHYEINRILNEYCKQKENK